MTSSDRQSLPRTALVSPGRNLCQPGFKQAASRDAELTQMEAEQLLLCHHRLTRHLEASHRLPRCLDKWMGYQGEVLPVNLTPRTGVTFGMPDKVQGTILKRPPREHPNPVLVCVDLDQRPWRKHVRHSVIFRADECVAVAEGIQPALSHSELGTNS